MRHDKTGIDGSTDPPCRYGKTRVQFRGPCKALDQPYIACIGGTETYGKFITAPFPALLETALQQSCVNLGCVNGGVDTFADDPAILQICNGAVLTIVQVMGANHLSNRFYTVHPRRNDRFLSASPALRQLYPEVDFTSFTFTRHLLVSLCAVSPVRFEIVVHELRQAWLARMRSLLIRLDGRSVLLWFSREAVSDCHWAARSGQLRVEPLFVTAAMLDRLRPLARGLVVVNPSDTALAQGTARMVVPPSYAMMAADLLGPACHEEAAAALIRACTALR